MPPWLIIALLAAFPGDGWNNLKHVTRDRLYAIVLRNGECQFGVLGSIGEQVMVLGTDSSVGLAIKRSQILRVSDNLAAPARTAVFSARSSWQDVRATVLTGGEFLDIVTQQAQEWKWKHPAMADDAIASEGVSIRKEDVRYVFYVRSKPLTTDEEYFHQNDLKWITSIPLLGELVPTRISVLLYNADLPEDDSPIQCH